MPELALRGGSPVRNTLESPWPAWPAYTERERQNLLRVLDSRNWGGFPSPNVTIDRFAKAFAAAHDAPYGTAVANGSVSLELALRVGDVKAGDEVIAPTYTWRASAGCAVWLNAVPVFADVRASDYTIDPDHVEALITPRTRAVVAVHLGSAVADIDRLQQICDKHGLFLIEDCAHAHGARWKGKGVGSWGRFGSFSFQSSKLMTAGEGGIVTCNAKIDEEKLQSYTNCGRKQPGYDSFDGWLFGGNYRMTEFQAAVLEAQLERLEAATLHRAANGRYLTELLERIEGIEPVYPDARITRQAHYQYIFKFKHEQWGGLTRDKFLAALDAEGVHADGPFYVPMHEHPWFNPPLDRFPLLKDRYPDGIHAGVAHTPVARRAAYEEACWLHYSYLDGSRDDVTQIAEAIAKIRRHAHELA